MASKIDTTRVERAFRRVSVPKNLKRLGAAVYDHKLSGGFEQALALGQSTWKSLDPNYKQQKAKKGYDARMWVRTGRTLKALTQGPLPRREGTSKGVRYKLIPGRWRANIRVTTFKPRRGKKPDDATQKKIFRNLNKGIDSQRQSKTAIGSKGRDWRGFPARDLFTWLPSDEAPRAAAIVAEQTAIMQGVGLQARTK